MAPPSQIPPLSRGPHAVEMEDRFRAFDWAATPLGPREEWPESLCTTVSLLLGSRHPMFVWWGPELVNIYNDAYIPILGDRHPEALGRPARELWADIWEVIGPQADVVLTEGRATWNDSLLLLMERYGFVEETYFTFSYSPAPDGEGGVGGLFCACTEETGRVLGERRLRVLRELGERRLPEGAGTGDVCQAAAGALAADGYDLPFALIYLSEPGGETASLCGVEGLEAGSPAAPERVLVGGADDVWELGRSLEASAVRIVDDLESRFGRLPAGPWSDDHTRRAAVLPLAGAEARPAGWLVAALSPRLELDADYRSFLELVAAQVANLWRQAADRVERTRMLLALSESEARFRSMADQAPVMIWVTEPDGSCTYLSRSWFEFTGQEPEDARGGGWLGAVHPDDRDEAERVFSEANQRREPFRIEYRLRYQDGSYRWAIDSAAPRFGPDGGFLGFVGSVLDIADRKEMEEALRAADRSKDEFLALLAHELRNPLAPIRNAAEVLKLSGSEEPRQRWAREVIERQSQHLTRLVDDLLDVSRITRGKVALAREPVDLRMVLERAVETSRPLIDLRRHELLVSVPHRPVRVDGDAVRLTQVVGNLLNNAAKYTDEGGTVALRLGVEGDEAVVRVEDDGIGLSPELVPHVFDHFTQAERSLDRAEGGLGLGLTLVRQLVERHGGRVEAASEGPGQGSRFTVRLPLVQPAQVEGRPHAERDPVRPPAGGRLRVLVVEDHGDSAEALQMVLELSGHEARTVGDGATALQVAHEFRPHAVLCDIGLPGMSGYEVAERLRSDPELGRVHMIALTGYGHEQARARGREAGFDHHLVKPVDPSVLGRLLGAVPTGESPGSTG